MSARGINSATSIMQQLGYQPQSKYPCIPLILGANANQSVTGTVAETVLGTITVPAGLLGTNGQIRIRTVWTYTNSANNKTLRIRYSAIGGTAFYANTVTTTATCIDDRTICAAGATNAQIVNTSNTAFGIVGAADGLSVDTTVATTIVITGQLASSGETITVNYTVEYIPAV